MHKILVPVRVHNFNANVDRIFYLTETYTHHHLHVHVNVQYIDSFLEVGLPRRKLYLSKMKTEPPCVFTLINTYMYTRNLIRVMAYL